MPRVIQILSRFVIGGPAIITANLTKYLAPDFQSLLIVGGKDDHEKDAIHLIKNFGIEVVTIDEMRRAISPKLDYLSYNAVKKVIKDFKPDIVHTHSAKAGMIGRLAAHNSNVKAITHTFHGHVFHSYFGKAKTNAIIQTERYLAKISDGIVAISPQQKKELAGTYKICRESKIKVIPLGVELEKFQCDQAFKRKTFRQKYKIEKDEIAIGLIGRIVPIKNHKLFIQVAVKAVQRTNKKLRFLIIGDGEIREQVEHFIAAQKIDYTYYPHEERKATVTCTSWVMHIDEALAGLDIVALTSFNEGTPVSLIEAQAAGKPVVATKVGGVEDVVLHNKTGFLVEHMNIENFVQYLLKLIDKPALRAQMGEEGKAFAFQQFSNERLLKDMANYYFELLGR